MSLPFCSRTRDAWSHAKSSRRGPALARLLLEVGEGIVVVRAEELPGEREQRGKPGVVDEDPGVRVPEGLLEVGPIDEDRGAEGVAVTGRSGEAVCVHTRHGGSRSRFLGKKMIE